MARTPIKTITMISITVPTPRRRVIFVFGHLDLTQAEFDEHYVPQLERAIAQKDVLGFVVGDARGADSMAAEWLCSRAAHVIVYHMFERPRNCPKGALQTVGGHVSDEERDAAMTRDSNEDICWIRPCRSHVGGSEKNLMRRAAKVSVRYPQKNERP